MIFALPNAITQPTGVTPCTISRNRGDGGNSSRAGCSRFQEMRKDDPFYHTKHWKILRRAILRRDGYLCRISSRYGKRIPATTVHHVFPREEFPEYQWEPWNLISVSTEVHNSLHDRTTNELTAEGRRLQERIARRFGISPHPPR